MLILVKTEFKQKVHDWSDMIHRCRMLVLHQRNNKNKLYFKEGFSAAAFSDVPAVSLITADCGECGMALGIIESHYIAHQRFGWQC